MTDTQRHRSEAQLEILARARVKALEVRKQNALKRQQEKVAESKKPVEVEVEKSEETPVVEEVEEEIVEVIKKPKKKKKQIVRYIEQDSSSSEEDIVYVSRSRKPKPKPKKKKKVVKHYESDSESDDGQPPSTKPIDIPITNFDRLYDSMCRF